MILTKGFVSFSDYPNEFAYLVPVIGCKEPYCKYCQNGNFLENKSQDFSEILNDVKRYGYNAIIFGGGEPSLKLGQILPVIKKAKEYGIKVGVQTKKIQKRHADKLVNYGVDYISYTVNDLPQARYNLVAKAIPKGILETKIIYIPRKTFFPQALKGNVVVQQFQNENCIAQKYRDIKAPNRDETLNFASSIGANEIITREKGREVIK